MVKSSWNLGGGDDEISHRRRAMVKQGVGPCDGTTCVELSV